MNTKKVLTRRIANVIEIGNSIGLTLRPELLDLNVSAEGQVCITVFEDENRDKTIVIEKVKRAEAEEREEKEQTTQAE